MRRINSILKTLLVLSVTLSTPAPAAVYKWVDEDGRTRYTDTPPARHRFETMRTAPEPAEDPDAERRRESLLQHLKDAEDARRRRAQEKQRRAEDETVGAENCRRARDKLELLQSRPAPRLRVTEPDGTMRAYTEEERQAGIAEAKAYIAGYCGQ